MKLYLSKLAAKGKCRWQTGRLTDPSKASGSGIAPTTRLRSSYGQTPMGALRAWILVYGSKLEEDSRKEISSRAWRSVPPTIAQEELL